MHALLVVYTNILSSLNLYTVSIATSYPSFNYSIIYSNIFAVYAVHVGTVCEEGKEEHVAQFLVFVHIPG